MPFLDATISLGAEARLVAVGPYPNRRSSFDAPLPRGCLAEILQVERW